MRLIRLFLQNGFGATAIAIVAGVLCGTTTACLLALVNCSLKQGGFHHDAGLIAGFVGLCITRLVAGIGSHWALIYLSQRTVRELRLKLCDKIIGVPLAHLEDVGAARLLAAFTEDLASLANVVVNLPYMFVNGVIIIGCLVYLGWLSGAMLAGIGICIALGAVTYILPVLWANRHLRESRQRQDVLFRYIRLLIDGIKELKLHHFKFKVFRNELFEAARAVEKCNVHGIAVYSAAANWNRLLFFLYAGILLLIVPAEVPQTLLAGGVLVLLYMMAPVEAVLNAIPLVAQAEIALQQIDKLNVSLIAVSEAPTACIDAFPPEAWTCIELIEVGYSYKSVFSDQPFAIGPISMRLERGKTTFITGGNGSGKTTLAKVITGLYLPDIGIMQVDTKAIDEANRREYRELFSAIFADYCLFDSLLGGNASSCDVHARKYLAELQLEGKLEICGGAFSTTALSQGQRKRLALLAALIEDRSVYVFDEWAADQDPYFREIFYTKILPGLAEAGKAVVVITHDDRYFHLADELLKLDQGRLTPVDRRTGDELSMAASKHVSSPFPNESQRVSA